MNAQDRFVSILEVATESAEAAKRSLEEIWTFQHTECSNFKTGKCIINSRDIHDCTFDKCPYIPFE